MLYKIKFISEEVDGFFREINIDSDGTFLDLSNAILKSCGYPDDQMTSFYVCNDEWERGQQITREDVSDPDNEEDLFLMSDTPLSDFIDDKGQRFEYVFDPFAERSFFVQVKEVIPGQHLDEAEVVRSKGDAPAQLEAFDDSLAVASVGAKSVAADPDEDDDFYVGGFDSEELDPEGFEISDGQPY